MDIGGMNMTAEIVEKFNETRDDFIFTTIVRSFGEYVETSKLIISKEILIRALACFREEHTEEYNRLIEESYKRAE